VDWTALRLSGRLALTTTFILLVIGTPIAYWLAFSPRRWKFLVEAVVALPLVLPPTVLGFYLLMATGPHSPVGRVYEAVAGSRLPFSFQGLVVASVCYSLPFAVQPMVVGFAGVDRRTIEAAWVLGAQSLRTFFRVIAPLSIPGIATAAILAFAHTLGEFGVVLMVGGNVPGRTRTVSISIYDQVQSLNYDAAGRTALLLLGVSFLVLAFTYALQRQVRLGWPART
jgi:molybdate transport system permease protein